MPPATSAMRSAPRTSRLRPASSVPHPAGRAWICSSTSMPRAACARPRSSAISSSRRAPMVRSPAFATSLASSWVRKTIRCVRCSTASRRSPSRFSRRPVRTRSRSRTTCARPWTCCSRPCRRASSMRSSTTRRNSSAPRSRRLLTRCSKPSRSSSWSSFCSCRHGAPRSSR